MKLFRGFVSTYAEDYVFQAMLVLKSAWDHGVTTIDTANIYSGGESEIVIGKFIKKVKRSLLTVSALTCTRKMSV